MIPKKTGGWRMAFDYRSMNKLTVPISYPLPYIESVLVISLKLKRNILQI